jgi:flagellar biosynthesis/type III secretory pathway M-ring protein FliF/YscJ
MAKKITPDSKQKVLIDAISGEVPSNVLKPKASDEIRKKQVLQLAKNDPKAAAQLLKQIIQEAS